MGKHVLYNHLNQKYFTVPFIYINKEECPHSNEIDFLCAIKKQETVEGRHIIYLRDGVVIPAVKDGT